jgi:hypothetical protein
MTAASMTPKALATQLELEARNCEIKPQITIDMVGQ